jgi:hypothetical protein
MLQQRTLSYLRVFRFLRFNGDSVARFAPLRLSASPMLQVVPVSPCGPPRGIVVGDPHMTSGRGTKRPHAEHSLDQFAQGPKAL